MGSTPSRLDSSTDSVAELCSLEFEILRTATGMEVAIFIAFFSLQIFAFRLPLSLFPRYFGQVNKLI